MSLLSDIDRQDILARFRKENVARDKMRLHILLLLDDGYDYSEIGDIFYINESTVRDYEKKFQIGKVQSVLKFGCKGSTGKLDTSQKKILHQHLQDNLYLRSADICHYIEQKFSEIYTPKGLVKLLKRLGFVYKKPKHVPGKADVKAQEAFLAKELKPALDKADEDNPVWFSDAMHPMHNSAPAYGWIEKGVDKKLKSNCGRARLNINGAYSFSNQKVVYQNDDRINAVSMIALLEQIKQASGTAKTITVVLDNAGYNHAKIVKKKAEELGIRLLYLPAYSPNLNLIERLWRFYNQKVRNNAYYEKFSEFEEKSLSFLDNLAQFTTELKSLMTPKFQFIR
jgi:transposase